jgi:hypothetical protein
MNIPSAVSFAGIRALTRFLLAFVASVAFTTAAAAAKSSPVVLPIEEFEALVRAKLDLGRWQLLMIDKSYILSLDSTTVKQTGHDVYQAWERWDYNDRRTDHFSYSLHKVIVDCAQRRYKYTSMIAYDAKNNVVKTWTAKSDSEAAWQEMVPGTVSEAEYGLLCGLFPSFEEHKRPVPLRPLRNE